MRSDLPKVLVSACLLGQPVRYDGRASGHPDVLQGWQAEGRVVPLCPEVAGGLPTPRPPAEIPGGQGRAVLDGQARVVTVTGEDVSGAFLAGARLALELVRRHGIRVAVLKSGSPSCGNRLVYDGSFTGVKVTGEGVTAALLRREGVLVFSELELEEAQRALAGIGR
ncbi:2-thiouracil desulfurase family protein [Pseudomonas sp. microsymbiont 2]